MTLGPLDPSDLRAFAGRRWDLVEDEAVRARADRYTREGPSASLAVSHALRDRYRRLHPTLSETARADDLAHHVAWRALLDRVAHVFRR